MHPRLERLGRVGLAFLSLFMGMPPALFAAPQGAQVVQGQAQLQASGKHTQITASDKAIINYAGFDIARDESVRFLQPHSSAWVLNRVLSARRTEIHGALAANGRVVLVNPSGLYFSSTATVDVNRFIAAGMDISNQSFLSNDWLFRGDGDVINEGRISAEAISLIGRQVVNTGSLISENGLVMLLAGESALISDPDGKVYVEVDGKALNDLKNANNPDAEDGTAIKNEGEIRGSKIVFGAGDMFSQAFTNTGNVAASVELGNGGEILIAGGGKVQNDGTLTANRSSGLQTGVNSAGKINIQGTDVTSAGAIEVKGGGAATVESTGTTIISGLVDASNEEGVGGVLKFLGEKVGLFDSATVNASGRDGGGEVLIGGDFQGKNPDVRNAVRTFVGEDVTITADATLGGDGGKVIVWSNDATRAHGSFSARGGPEGGDGGHIETSGHFLDTAGIRVSASAPKGAAGLWLLDPFDTTISSATTANGDALPNFNATSTGAVVNNGDIITQLQGGTSVTVFTGSSGSENGDITVTASITASLSNGDVTFTLQAADDILFTGGSDITASGGNVLHVTLNSDRDNNGAGGISLASGTTITSNGGNITLGGGADPTSDDAVGADGGDVEEGILLDGASLISGAGDISLRGTGSGSDEGILFKNSASATSTSGDITFTGTGGSSGSDNDGIEINGAGSTVQVQTGVLSLTGTSGPSASRAIFLNNGKVLSTGSGNISLTATANGSADAFGGFSSTIGGGSATGDITITADSYTGNGAVQSTGALTIKPETASETIGIGGGTGNLDISDTELGQFNDGFSSITIGDATGGTGAVNVDSSTFNDPVTIVGGSIVISGDLSVGSNNVTLNARTGTSDIAINSNVTSNDDVHIRAGRNITSTGGTTTGDTVFFEGTDIGTSTNDVNTSATTLGVNATGGVFISESDAVDFGTVNDLIDGGTFNGLTVGGDLNITVGGDLTDSSASSVTGTTFLTAGSNNITLDTAGNNFSTVSILSSNNATLVDTNALVLGASTVSGALNVTAGGELTDSGALNVTGTTFLTAGGNNITLDDGSNAFSTVSVISSNNATLVDTNALILGASTVSGALNITAGGELTDSGTLAVTGTTFLTAGSNNITLDDGSNNFSTVSIISSNNATLVDTNALVLGASTISDDLTITANGDVTDSGTLTVTSAASLNATGNNITLNDGSNDFSTVGISSSNNATLVDVNLITLNASSVGGALNVTAQDLDISGALSVTGATFINESNGDGLGLGGTSVSGGLNISGTELELITSTGLTLTTSADVVVNGITGTNSDNISGTVVIDSGNNVTFSTADSTFNALDVQADDGIIVSRNITTDTGALTLDGDDDNATDNDDDITFASGITLTSNTTLTLDATAGNIDGAGALTLNAKSGVTLNDDLTLSASGALTVDADTDNNGGAFSAQGLNTTAGAVDEISITAADVTLSGAVNAGGGNVSLIPSQNGTAVNLGDDNGGGFVITDTELDQITSSATVTIGNANDASTITVDNVTGPASISGTLVLTSNGDITFSGNDSSIGSNLKAISTTGNITDSASLIVSGSGNFTTSAANGIINLGSLNVTGQLSLTTSGASGNATIVNAQDVDLLSAAIGGDLGATATTGNLIDSGNIVVGDDATFTTSASNAIINLGSLNATGSIGLTTSGASG
ncbi:MAG: filamentous hemagglutinin N-terminal domain-containing protein, partial [Planctomycetota bacterium]|nr:filamentous hemagglutinin N-terminal domain-containing protein [Planctomycetota bacterium]